MRENDVSGKVIGCALEVQRVLGVGLLESAYAAALAYELGASGLSFSREVPLPGWYKGHALGVAYRADFIVEDCVIVEIKAVEAVNELHRAQLLSYLKLSGLRLGVLINFHDWPLRKGVHRLAHRL